MKTFSKISLIFTLIIAISACKNDKNAINSEVANKKITIHNLQEIAEQVANDPNFSQENMELFINALTRLGAEKDSIVDKTVVELIENQRKFLRERTAEATINSCSRIALFINHKFEYIGISFNDTNESRKINEIIFDVTNISDKEIKKVEGELQFYLPRGELVKVFTISTATPIPASKDTNGVRFSMPFYHDGNSERDKIIRESRELSAVWTPTAIEFSDGSKMIDLTKQKEKQP